MLSSPSSSPLLPPSPALSAAEALLPWPGAPRFLAAPAAGVVMGEGGIDLVPPGNTTAEVEAVRREVELRRGCDAARVRSSRDAWGRTAMPVPGDTDPLRPTACLGLFGGEGLGRMWGGREKRNPSLPVKTGSVSVCVCVCVCVCGIRGAL
jgi:hypothetical protein